MTFGFQKVQENFCILNFKTRLTLQMEWYDKFKRFLGFPEHREDYRFPNEQRQPPNHNEEYEPPFHGRTFGVFTDPLEIHKYFEHQISEMLSSFGFHEFGDDQFSLPQFGDNFGFPQLEEIPDENVQMGDLREQFLKPGYEKSLDQPLDEKRDKDIDGKLDIKDWGSVFKGDNNSVVPFQRQVIPKSNFFGQSVTTKTVRNPDGSVETHRTVRDNQGNEETTITRRIGDKEHSITKRRDKDGKEETIENLVNLDEKEVGQFFPKQQTLPDASQSWPFFDRFFR